MPRSPLAARHGGRVIPLSSKEMRRRTRAEGLKLAQMRLIGVLVGEGEVCPREWRAHDRLPPGARKTRQPFESLRWHPLRREIDAADTEETERIPSRGRRPSPARRRRADRRRASMRGWLLQRSGRRPFAIVDIHALAFSDIDVTSLAILRCRVSGVFALSIVPTCLRLRPKARRSNANLASGWFRRARARSGGGATTLGAVSSFRSTTTMSPSAIPLATRFAALIPTRHCPRIRATLLRHAWPLIVTVIAGRAPERRASTTSFGTSIPVALPEGMTLALNFMFVFSGRPVKHPTVP